ncbi:MAG: hypothetical protein NC902_08055, partial [Candidatus Omnitrophica bacterium]|nr:hypothetical protein [Candidatus Omnitrophota bacterium]
MNGKLKVVMPVSHPVIEFAAKELKKYLRKSGFKGRLNVVLSCGGDSEKDEIQIKFSDNHYLINGSNPRSVLFGTYKFLYELGFRWIRPGNRREIVPEISRIKQNIFV